MMLYFCHIAAIMESNICPYATSQVITSKRQILAKKLETFGDQNQENCHKHSTIDRRYAKTKQHPHEINPTITHYPLADYDICHKNEDWERGEPFDPEEHIVASHLTESSLELRLSQGCIKCDDNNKQSKGDKQHVPDLLYYGPDSDSSSYNSSSISQSSCGSRQNHIFSKARYRPSTEISDYSDDHFMDDVHRIPKHPVVNLRTRNYLLSNNKWDGSDENCPKDLINSIANENTVYKHHYSDIDPVTMSC